MFIPIIAIGAWATYYYYSEKDKYLNISVQYDSCMKEELSKTKDDRFSLFAGTYNNQKTYEKEIADYIQIVLVDRLHWNNDLFRGLQLHWNDDLFRGLQLRWNDDLFRGLQLHWSDAASWPTIRETPDAEELVIYFTPWLNAVTPVVK